MARIVLRERVDRGAINDLIETAWAHYKRHGRESLADAFKEAAADKVIQRYEVKIRNGFERAGVTLPEGELTTQAMLAVIKERTGLELDSLNPEAVTAAVDRLLSERLSDALGVPVATVFDREAMMNSLNQAVLEAIRNGRAAEFVNRTAMSAARRYMTYKRAGISEDNAVRLDARRRQKKFRRTHKLIWL